MSIPNPAGAVVGAGLPIVHVHGGTSWRRRVFLVVLALIPGLVATAVNVAVPFEGGSDVSTMTSSSWLGTLWLLLAARSFPPVARWSRHISATLVGAAWAFAAAWVTLDRDAVSWSGTALAIVAVCSLLGLWLGWWVAGVRFGIVGPLVPVMPTAATPTTRSAWSETSVNRPHLVVLLALGMFVFGTVIALLPGSVLFLGVLLALGAYSVLAGLPFAIRSTADRRGLRIRSRLLGIPLVTVPLERIRSATAATIDEAEWGQVGSTADPELTTIIHRSGAALIVTCTDGSMVVVTAERPREAAAVLETLRSHVAHEPD